MWISDSIGGLTHLDFRENEKRPRRYALSEQKIGSVSVNPREPHFLLTASNSRALKWVLGISCYCLVLRIFVSISIWDARKLDSIPIQKLSTAFGTDKSTPFDFDSATVQKYLDSKVGQGTLRGEWTHGKSVSSAYWDPRGRSIVSTSYDDQLRCEACFLNFFCVFLKMMDEQYGIWISRNSIIRTLRRSQSRSAPSSIIVKRYVSSF